MRLIEVEGSADTIVGVIKSLGDLGLSVSDDNNGQSVRVRHVRKATAKEPQLPIP